MRFFPQHLNSVKNTTLHLIFLDPFRPTIFYLRIACIENWIRIRRIRV